MGEWWSWFLTQRREDAKCAEMSRVWEWVSDGVGELMLDQSYADDC